MSNANFPHNRLTFRDKLTIALILLPLPMIIIWALLQSPFTTQGRFKHWKRIAFEAASLWIMRTMTRKQMRAIIPSTRAVYEDFMKQARMEPIVEELGEDARLLWIGRRKTDRVLLYFHGGAFLFSSFSSAPAYWNLMKRKLGSRGIQTDAVMLNYTLVPDAMFPVQLSQAVLSIQRLLSLGFKPENIQIVGDSAGGALIHQVLSHILHPVEGVPKLNLASPFGGVYIMSPWVRLVGGEGSLHRRGNVVLPPFARVMLWTGYLFGSGPGNVIDASIGDYWGSKVLAGVDSSALPYLQAATIPKGWLQGVDKYVRRILISAGDLESQRDEIVHYGKHVEEYIKDTTIIVQENGIHDDPFYDLLIGKKDLGSLSPKVLDWLEEGFR